MAGRILVAALLAGVLMFLWGFLFWGVIDASSALLSPLPQELDVLAPLRNAQAPTGMYVYPLPSQPADDEAIDAYNAKHEEGPLLQLAYIAEGGPAMPPSKFAKGLGHSFLVALLASCIVALAGSGLPSFGRRLAAVVLMSVLVAVWSNVGDAIWWFHSPRYALGNAAYMVGCGVLMGLAIAAIVRPPAAAETS